eukprot:12915133-Prorocentrum_lima.AAC.1
MTAENCMKLLGTKSFTTLSGLGCQLCPTILNVTAHKGNTLLCCSAVRPLFRGKREAHVLQLLLGDKASNQLTQRPHPMTSGQSQVE